MLIKCEVTDNFIESTVVLPLENSEERSNDQAVVAESIWASKESLELIEAMPYCEQFIHSFEELMPRGLGNRTYVGLDAIFIPPAPPDLPVVRSISLPPQLHRPKSRISISSKDIYS
ncbi:hypothetical protein CFP56_043697 [Quercus suber]|uniref:Uncharacterized protein n=1 Tax=Quercus suber TaxID=58331 RepID=A0AAW0IPU4_QUESU